MPTVVATLQAVIGADDSGFQAGVKRTQDGTATLVVEFGALDKAVASLEETTKNLSQGLVTLASSYERVELENAKLKQSLQETKTETVDFNAKLQTVAGTAVGLGATLTASVTAPIVGIGVGAVQSATRMDSLTRALVSTTGSAKDAAREFRELAEIGKAPGIGFQEAVTGAVRLQAAGLSAKQAEDAIKGFGNALVAAGKGKEDLVRVEDEFTRLASRATVSGRSIMEISRQIPQLRQIMQKAFGTSDTMELESLGVDTKQFVQIMITELNKLPHVVGGAQNAFDNLGIAANKSLASVGKDLLPVVQPALEGLTTAIEYQARIWTQLDAPVKVSIGLFAGTAAAIGPLIVTAGGLGFAVVGMTRGWQAWLTIQPLIQGQLAAATGGVTTFTGALFTNVMALTTWRGAVLAGTAALASLTVGYTIGAMINDAYITSIDRARQKIEDETASRLKSIPYLEKAYIARKKLQDLESLAAEHPEIRDTQRFKELSDNVQYLSEKYRQAQKDMTQEFDSAAAERKATMEKETETFEKELKKRQDELTKLRAPDLEAKLHVDFPDITPAKLKELAATEKQIEAEKELQKTRKQAADEARRSAEDFAKKIRDATLEISALRGGGNTNLAQARREAPAGTSEAQIRELATLRDQIDALKKAQQARDTERQKIDDLAAKLGVLGGALSTAAAKADILSRSAHALSAGPSTFMGPPAPARLSGGPLPNLGGGGGRRFDGLGPIYNGPPLPPVGSVVNYADAMVKVKDATAQAATAQTQFQTAAQQTAAALASDIGVENATRLADSTRELRSQLLALRQTQDIDRTSAELTGKTYDQLSKQTAVMVLQAQRLKDAIKNAQLWEDSKNAMRESYLELATATAKTQEEREAISLLKREYDRLSPALQARIDQISAYKRAAEGAQKAQEQERHLNAAMATSLSEARMRVVEATGATDAERVAFGLLGDVLKQVPPNVTTAAGVFDYLGNVLGVNVDKIRANSNAINAFVQQARKLDEAKRFMDSLSAAVAESRLKFLQAWAASDAEREALTLLKDHIKDLPPEINTASGALDYLTKRMGAAGAEAVKVGAQVADMNAKSKVPAEIAKSWDSFGKELAKIYERNAKAIANFDEEMSKRMEAARARISGAKVNDPAQAAWLEYLVKNDALAKALANDAGRAADEYARFKSVFQAEQQATAVDKLQKMLAEFNEKVREANSGLSSGQKHVSDYDRVLAQLGITADQVDSRMDAMIRGIVNDQQRLNAFTKFREELKSLTADMTNIFEHAFTDLFQHGFGSFFTDVVNGFEKMLEQMAAKWLASEVMKLITQFIQSIAGGIGGGAGGGLLGTGLQAGEGGILAGLAANGGPVDPMRPYIVGENGPELFVPGARGSVVPNHALGGSHITYAPVYNIQTQDANSFRRSQGQIMDDGQRHLDRLRRRNGNNAR